MAKEKHLKSNWKTKIQLIKRSVLGESTDGQVFKTTSKRGLLREIDQVNDQQTSKQYCKLMVLMCLLGALSAKTKQKQSTSRTAIP